MALITRGITRCAHCERVIAEGDAAVSFTVFVANAVDPLYGFNDAVFHAACLGEERLGAAALERQAETFKRLGPKSHVCAVCELSIAKWDQNVTVPHLSASAGELKKFDYLQFHRGCLPRWEALTEASDRISAAMSDGKIAGDVVERLLAELRRAAAE